MSIKIHHHFISFIGHTRNSSFHDSFVLLYAPKFFLQQPFSNFCFLTSLLQDLGGGFPTFIIAQTPMPNTVNDFWAMIWSQNVNTVVCLHPPAEVCKMI